MCECMFFWAVGTFAIGTLLYSVQHRRYVLQPLNYLNLPDL